QDQRRDDASLPRAQRQSRLRLFTHVPATLPAVADLLGHLTGPVGDQHHLCLADLRYPGPYRPYLPGARHAPALPEHDHMVAGRPARERAGNPVLGPATVLPGVRHQPPGVDQRITAVDPDANGDAALDGSAAGKSAAHPLVPAADLDFLRRDIAGGPFHL